MNMYNSAYRGTGLSAWAIKFEPFVCNMETASSTLRLLVCTYLLIVHLHIQGGARVIFALEVETDLVPPWQAGHP